MKRILNVYTTSLKSTNWVVWLVINLLSCLGLIRPLIQRCTAQWEYLSLGANRYMVAGFTGGAEEAQTGMPTGVTLLIDALNQAHAFVWFYCFVILSTVAYSFITIYTQQRYQLFSVFVRLTAARASYTVTPAGGRYFHKLVVFSGAVQTWIVTTYVARMSSTLGASSSYLRHTAHSFNVNGVCRGLTWLRQIQTVGWFQTLPARTIYLMRQSTVKALTSQAKPPLGYANPFIVYDNWLVECVMLVLPTFILLAIAAPITSLHYSIDGLDYTTSAEIGFTGRQWVWDNYILAPLTVPAPELILAPLVLNPAEPFADLLSRIAWGCLKINSLTLIKYQFSQDLQQYDTVREYYSGIQESAITVPQLLLPAGRNVKFYNVLVEDYPALIAIQGMGNSSSGVGFKDRSDGTDRTTLPRTNQQGLTNIATPLPALAWTRIYVDSLDVIHALWAWSYGIKVDCIPDNPTQTTVFPKQYSISTGSCAEYCGVNHTSMGVTFRAYDHHVYKYP